MTTIPMPTVTPEQEAHVASLAQGVLDARALFPELTLAQLYDPDTMPQPLRDAHAALDDAVDRLYRPEGFASDAERVAHLFALYAQMTGQEAQP